MGFVVISFLTGRIDIISSRLVAARAALAVTIAIKRGLLTT
jgi:hypothetical protein